MGAHTGTGHFPGYETLKTGLRHGTLTARPSNLYRDRSTTVFWKEHGDLVRHLLECWRFGNAVLVRYLHLLAHHPDFDASEIDEGLPALAKYIEFYLDLVATSENVSLLYHLAQQCKTVRDKEGHTYSENLYLLSELADYAIKQRAQNNGWTIPSYPDKINMPKDIFNPLPTAVAAKEVRSTVYLTDEKIGWIGEMGKTVKSPQAKTRKRRAPAASKSKRPAKRRKKNMSDDEEDEKEQSDEEDELSSIAEAPAPTSDEDMSEGDDSEEEASAKKMALGRGARGRAKAKAHHKAKKTKKQD